MKRYLSVYLGKSIKRLVMASFVVVLLLPIGFFIYSLFQNSWQQVEQRMVEKHHLISDALVEPFSLFVSTRQQALHSLGQELLRFQLDEESRAVVSSMAANDRIIRVQHILDKHLNAFGNFVALSYASSPDAAISCTSNSDTGHVAVDKPDYSGLSLVKLPAVDGRTPDKDFLSPVFQSPLSGKPVILLKHFVYDKQQVNKGVVYAEISLDQIGSMCSQINFGVKGHCAVVDNTGHVVAHPNKDWVKSIKDLSGVSVVQKMLAGDSGTTEFYSPFLKADMVAGFSPIPYLGWGVMIPQPKSELTKLLDNARIQTMIWMGVGVLIALIIAVVLTKKVTRPINLLIRLTHKSDRDYDSVDLGTPPANTPLEIKQLWESFSNLLSGLQSSNKEIKRLNISLKKDVELATAELREMNKHLYETSTQDYLTSLSNRRHFTHYINTVLKRDLGKNVGLIMIDVDKFKQLNDRYGHEAGDMALQHLSSILLRSTRPCDLVARLGGDEFVVYVENPQNQTLAKCGERIRQNTEESPLILEDGTKIPITLSVGMVNRHNGGGLSLQELFRCADHAMYDSKASGRNQVSTYHVEVEQPDLVLG